ncbi:MAG TPA: DNA ligase D, partial [Bryobacteraceae bacterium]|nr:DNA ligase D [Bryobacteraceae bacterium]
MSLDEYARKRDFTRTPEPGPAETAAGASHSGRFFVQRHNASHLHYDFRLELGGTLKSWAVPKGPSLDPTVKTFAAMVEDHPLSYGDFEGNIPRGNYGGGSVMLWDRGVFEIIGEEDGIAQIERGDLKFRLHGEKLAGTWAIVRMKGRGKGNEWLLIKKKDEAAVPDWDIEAHAVSIKTGRTQEEIAADLPPKNQPHKKSRFNPATLNGAVKAPMPGFFAPMGAQITEHLPKGPGWLHEIKWDGVRVLAQFEAGALTLTTRNNNRCERQYPELQVLPHYIDAERAIIDGEVVALDSNGISKFELIQPRIHQTGAHTIAKMAQKSPVHFYAFDLLYLDGYDLRKVPLVERKRALAAILKPFQLLRYSDHFADSGEQLLEAARQTGLEGLVSKRANSCYESRRSADWLKLKLTSEQEFLIAGYTPGERDTFASLVLAFYDEDGKLAYAGNVGTGFTEQTLREILAQLEPRVIPKSPLDRGTKIPKGTIWVKPELIAQVKFANWTSEARLRAPVFIGLRTDKAPIEVEREVPAAPEPTLKFTNLDKIYFPESGITKGEVILYYDTVASLILPHLKDRPLSLKRYPNGIQSEYFFQKNTPDSYPAWLRTELIDKTRFIVADDKKTLLYLANLGCIDQNPWMSRVGSLANPDFILLDIDPFECAFPKVVEAALLVKEKLDAIGLTGYPKTTGGDGLHVYIPVEPVYTYEQARFFAEVIARLLAAEHPKLFTTPRAVEKREKDRVYFDWMQIAESKTISAP